MCAFRERRMISPAIHQFDGVVSDQDELEVVVACSQTPWYGKGVADDTAELALQAGATVRRFSWQDEKDQKNWIMDKFHDKDWVLMFAPDMYMEKQDIQNTLESLKQGTERAYACPMVTYWKDYTHQVLPARDFNSLAIRPNERFNWSALINNHAIFNRIPNEPVMHHLSFVRTDEEMHTKLSTWSHAPNVLPNWYEEKWLKGDDLVHNFGLESAGDMEKLTSAYFPDSLRALIQEYGQWKS